MLLKFDLGYSLDLCVMDASRQKDLDLFSNNFLFQLQLFRLTCKLLNSICKFYIFVNYITLSMLVLDHN